MMGEWTMADQARAFTQGWGIFENSDHGIRIERLDEKSIFEDDEQAVNYVRLQAAAGSALARKAIVYVKRWGKL